MAPRISRRSVFAFRHPLIGRLVRARIAVSRWKGILTVVEAEVVTKFLLEHIAATFIGEFQDIIFNRLEVGLDPLLALKVVGTEPDDVGIRGLLGLEGGVCLGDSALGAPNGLLHHLQPVVPTVLQIQFRLR